MTRYAIGRDDEYATRDIARADGLVVVRAAGSLGSADLLAFHSPGRAYALNVKRGVWAPPRERTEMAKWWRVGVFPILVRVVIAPGLKGGRTKCWEFRKVRGDGTMGNIHYQPPWVIHREMGL